MGLRAAMRRSEKDKKKAKTATYNFTEEQLQAAINEGLDVIMKEREERYRNQAINTALLLLLSLPSTVLKEDYWPKSYKKQLPGFNQKILDRYNQFLNGELDLDELSNTLWEDVGIKFEEGELL